MCHWSTCGGNLCFSSTSHTHTHTRTQETLVYSIQKHSLPLFLLFPRCSISNGWPVCKCNTATIGMFVIVSRVSLHSPINSIHGLVTSASVCLSQLLLSSPCPWPLILCKGTLCLSPTPTDCTSLSALRQYCYVLCPGHSATY